MRVTSVLIAMLGFVAAWPGAFAAPASDVSTDFRPEVLNIQPDRIAVAGISSGGFMATQLQLAYPETFPRAAALAGGPYDCFAVAGAMTGCLYPSGLTSDQLNAMVSRATRNAGNHLLGDLTQLDHGVFYALYGTEDEIVGPKIAGSVAAFYRQLKASLGSQLADLQVGEDGTHDFGHTFPTYLPPLPISNLRVGDNCNKSVSPFIGRCGFDGAKNILEHLYPDIKTGAQPDGAPGRLTVIPVKSFAPAGGASIGDYFYTYTPAACLKGQPCGLLLALHGCNQNDSMVGLAFVRDAGFNRWADDYRLIAVYPQTRSTKDNFGGCWDWWGYTGARFDTRDGPQIAWLNRLVTRLTHR
jgi:hypothetical protein